MIHNATRFLWKPKATYLVDSDGIPNRDVATPAEKVIGMLDQRS
jgi:hypothetical protein